MFTRVAVGLTGLAILMPAVIYGGGLAVEIIVTLALVVGLDEYSRMAVPGAHLRAFGVLLVTGGMVYSAMLWGSAVSVVPSIALGAIIILVYALFFVKETARGADMAARLLAGMLYVPVLLAFLVWVRRFDQGVIWIFVVLGAAWGGDTGAFFAGRFLGRHKLFVRVSPKKTWEGAIGGLVVAIAWTCAMKHFYLPGVSWAHAVVLGALLDISGVVGDLVESMFKRSFGVKDSGWIMPGHGGILDRVDSVLLIAPVCWIYATLFGLA